MYRASRARLRSVLSVSRALDGLLLFVSCAFVSPRCHVQGSRSRGSSLRPSCATSRWPIPSRRWRRRLSIARCQRTSRRPQGVRPDRNSRCDPRPLLRFSTPSGWLQRSWQCRRTPSARDLHRRHTRAPQAGPQRLDRSLAFPSVPRGSSRSSFPSLAAPSVPSGSVQPPTPIPMSTRCATPNCAERRRAWCRRRRRRSGQRVGSVCVACRERVEAGRLRGWCCPRRQPTGCLRRRR